tara:strand:+ start:23 stop:616 length:594 start_codon:yes stop_codon:yes gene_type:complete
MTLAIAFAKKSDGSKVGYVHSIDGLHGDDAFYLQAAADNFGGAPSDYAIYRTNDTVISERLRVDDDFIAIIDGQGNISSLDFSIEDNRLLVELSTDKAGDKIRALPDGTYDPINIIVQLYEPDGETLNTTYNGIIEVIVINPNKQKRYVEAAVTNGTLTTPFVPRHLGIYEIKEIVKNGTKLKAPLSIKVYHEAVSV